MNRLRAVRASEQFESLPDSLREKVRQLIANSEPSTTQSGPPPTISGTILKTQDFVVIVRRWRQQGLTGFPGTWTPASVSDDRMTAKTMADLILEQDSELEARVISAYDLMNKLAAEDRERILDRLNSRTPAEIERGRALREAARARLGSGERRSGGDRRSGLDRRALRSSGLPRGERRWVPDRRSGRDRRGAQTAA